MNKKQKAGAAKPKPQENKRMPEKAGLTLPEKKRLAELKRVLAGNSKEQAKPDTAQKTITFKKMYRDGICQVADSYYTKMVEFYDINYDLLEVEDQADILEEYSKLINYFDPSIKFQLFLFNRQVSEQALAEQFDISLQGDAFDDIRDEYTQMLKHQSAKGNNGIIKSKYLIFGMESAGYREAKSKLSNIEKDMVHNLNNIGTNARGLDGKERLRILHEYFNQGTMEPFRFSFKELSESGKSVKDYIAPPGFDFRYPSRFKSGSIYGSVSYLDMIAPKFTDEMVKKLLDIDDNLTLTMHVETCVLLTHKKPTSYIEVTMDYETIVPNQKPGKATYKMITDYVKEKYDLVVKSTTIAEVKRSFGLEVGDYNVKDEKTNYRKEKITPEKRQAVEDALRHFGVIE